jgi:hypothetical protein
MTALVLCVCAGNASAAELRPDIDVHAPYGLVETTDGGSRTFVAFDSFVENVGAGPLKLLGQRPSAAVPQLTVTQVLLDSASVTTGVVERTAPAGQMAFSPSASHNHWHYLRFQDYMLLSVPDLQFVAPTRKTGFCLVGLNLAFACGGGLPGLLQVGDPAEAVAGAGPFPNTQAMGMIAAGGADADPNRSWSDHYGPSVEGQDVEITGVPDGRYCLSFVVDPAGRLVEGSTANNGASRLLDIGTDGSGRTVSQGAAFHDTATCGLTDPGASTGTGNPPPATPPTTQTTGTTGDPGTATPAPARVRRPSPLTSTIAARMTRTAVRARFRGATGIAARCTPRGLDAGRCAVGFRVGQVRYRGALSLSQRRVARDWRWYYRLSVGRTRGPARQVRTGTLLGGVLGVDRAAARRVAGLPAGAAVPERPGDALDDALLCRLP